MQYNFFSDNFLSNYGKLSSEAMSLSSYKYR